GHPGGESGSRGPLSQLGMHSFKGPSGKRPFASCRPFGTGHVEGSQGSRLKLDPASGAKKGPGAFLEVRSPEPLPPIGRHGGERPGEVSGCPFGPCGDSGGPGNPFL